jgi:hypothetical protein
MKCTVADATRLDYVALFKQEDAPSLIPALSIDVDAASMDALRAIPFDTFSFKSIIIEHDIYRFPFLRSPEREFLEARDYELLFSDILHEAGKPFEDWWIKRDQFSQALVEKWRGENLRDIDAIRRFGQKNNIIRKFGFNEPYPQYVEA